MKPILKLLFTSCIFINISALAQSQEIGNVTKEDNVFDSVTTYGCLISNDFFNNLTKKIEEKKKIDPELLSFEFKADFLYGYYKDNDAKDFHLGGYDLELRFNLALFFFEAKLMSFKEINYDDVSFESRPGFIYDHDLYGKATMKIKNLNLGINLIHKKKAELAIGTGTYNILNDINQQYFLYTKFHFPRKLSNLNINVRTAIDYIPENKRFLFFETVIYYERKVLKLDILNGYLYVGPFYQNYRELYDVYGVRIGVRLNILF